MPGVLMVYTKQQDQMRFSVHAAFILLITRSSYVFNKNEKFVNFTVHVIYSFSFRRII